MPNQLGIIHPNLLPWLVPNFFPSQITIQVEQPSRTPTGAVTAGWVDVEDMVDLACRIAPQGGQESRTTQQILTQELHICEVPLELAGVTTKHRAVVDGRVYDIVTVANDGQQQPGGHRRLTRLTLKVVR